MQRHAPLVLSTIMAIGLALALVPLPPTSAAVAPPTEVRAAGVRADVDPIPDGVTRLSGASRYETAVAVSQRHAPGVPVAFVASGADFPDALAAASAAALAGGPLLLTSPSYRSRRRARRVAATAARPHRTHRRRRRGQPGRAADPQRHRSDRRAWPVPTATRPGSRSSGRSSPPPTTPSSRRGAPSLMRSPQPARPAPGARRSCSSMEHGTTVSTATLAELDRLGVRSISIAGGPGAVSDAIRRSSARSGYEVARYGGETRYDTAALINRAYFPPGSSRTTFLATGSTSPTPSRGRRSPGSSAARST